MRNEETDFPSPKKSGAGSRQAKGCCLLIVSILVAGIILVIAGIAGIIIVDTVNTRGEGYTFSQRVQRYKVAGQFLWADFRTWVSRKISDEHEPSDEKEPFD